MKQNLGYQSYQHKRKKRVPRTVKNSETQVSHKITKSDNMYSVD